jgi:anti-sigma factor RsiW
MLSCRDLAHQHASAYLDGQLSWRTRTAVRLHLLLCQHCRRFIAQLRQVRALVAARPPAPPEPPTEAGNLALDQLAGRLHALHLQQSAAVATATASTVSASTPTPPATPAATPAKKSSPDL